MRKFTKRTSDEYNWVRATIQFLVSRYIYTLYFRLVYRLEVQGKKNIPKDKNFILAGNHLSAADPFLMIDAVGRPIAYMAKEELFQKPVMRFFLNWMGAFAVNREKLDVSTIKTVLQIKKTKWSLGLFPQGTRIFNQKIENVSRGFAALAKTTKTDVLPIAIIGADKKTKIPFTGKIIIKVGEVIPYSDDVDDVVDKWCRAISELTGFEYKFG